MLKILILLLGTNYVFAAGNSLIYGETGRLTQFDPYTVHEASGHRLSDLLFDSLISIGPGYEYVANLAVNWEKNSSATKVVFNLRPGVFWHPRSDAEKPMPFTANDVVRTIELITADKSEIPNKDRFNAISHAKALGDHKVEVYFRYAITDPLRVMMFKLLPAHMFPGQTVLTRDSQFATHPIGTGPYRFVKASGQGEILLTANKDYFRGAPKIESIVMRNFSDQSIMSKSLTFSSLDLVTYVSPRDIGEIAGDKRLGLVSYDALSYSFIGFNTSKPYLSDKNFRQGLSYAVNRQEMLDAFFDGKGDLISGPFPPSSWAYNLHIKPIGYDLERARKLITGAGYNSEKVKPFVFLVPLTGDGEMIKRIVLAYQSYLQQVGIAIDLQFTDWLVWKDRVLNKHDYDMTIASWSFDDASNILSLFHSSQTASWGHNFVQYKNPLVDTLLNEAEVTNDRAKKRAIYHKLHAILADETPYTFLWTLKHHAAYQKRIRRVRVEPYAFFRHIITWNVGGEALQ